MVRVVGVLGIALTLVVGVACDSEDPCRDYVDYVCDCHDGEEGYDCATMRETYADADPDVQDQCALDLQALEDQDQADGLVCATTGT